MIPRRKSRLPPNLYGTAERKPVTMPPLTLREVTDSDVGLTPDPMAQIKAEEYVRATMGHQRHRTRIVSTHPVISIARVAALSDEELDDVPAELVADIATELRCIVNRPRAS